MAKPYGEVAGSGFHLHASLLDKDGNNVFNNGTDEGSDLLRQAIAGMIALMPESMLLFAPNLNSYRRFQPGCHAPITASWGYENRTAALRIPTSSNKARRFEHRLAGADANPYLVIAVILAGALYGLENKLVPPPAVSGDAYSDEIKPEERLPTDWNTAIQAFIASETLKEILGPVFHRAFSTCKAQECEELGRKITDIEYQTYLGSI